MDLRKEISERLKLFAEQNFERQTELAALLGMKPQSLNSYFAGKSIPGGDILNRLAGLGCDINWLLTGEGDVPSVTSNISLKNEYPLLGLIPAGKYDFTDLSEWHEKRTIDYDPDTHFFLKVDAEFGYSMMPLVHPGDLILVSTTAKVKDGDLVVAIYDKTKGALKILTLDSDMPGTAVLTSYNQAITPIFKPLNKVKLYKVVLIEKCEK